MSETCTMGGADGYFLGAVIGFPFVVLAALLNIKSAKLSKRFNILSVVMIVFPCLFVGFVWFDLFVSTTIYGNHICGQEYNSYIEALGTNYWYLPILHLALLFILIGSITKRVRA